MSIILVYLVLLGEFCSATTFLRLPNSRGPGAALAGRNCLNSVARYYFNETRASRTKNMVIMHSANLSAPAAEIEVNFLTLMHKSIASYEMKGIQLRVISNSFSATGLINVDPNAVTLTDYYVVVVDDFEKLAGNMNHFINVGKSFNPAGKFIVMFAQPSIDLADRYSIANRIFHMMYNHYRVIHVVVCISAGYLKYDVYLTNPYRNPGHCGSLNPELVGQCNDGRLVNDAETERHLKMSVVPERMNGCVFNFCTRVTEPYMEPGCKEGLEMEMMHILKSVLQFKRGEQLPNGTWTHLLGMLRSKKCDVLVGGFFPDNEVHDEFAVTNTYMQDSYTWYVFLAALEDPWHGLIEIFDMTTWVLFFLILITAALAWWLFGLAMPEKPAHKKLQLVTLNTWAVFLNVSANNRPDYTPLRVFFIMLAIYGLNVTTVYTSNLITMFTEPKHEAQLDTIEEIIEAGLPIGGREEYSDWFENDQEHDQRVLRRYNSSELFEPTNENLQRVCDGLQSMLINRFYVLSSSMRDQIFDLPGNVFSNPLEMIAERGFPLLRKLNTLIDRMKDSGLIIKIYNDFLYKMNLKEGKRMREQATENQVVLTVEHLEGAFALLILGYLLSTLVFVLELISVTQRYVRFKEHCLKVIQGQWDKLLIWMRLKEKPKPAAKRVKFQLKKKHIY